MTATSAHSRTAWDGVVDTSGYVPRIVRQSAELLRDAVDRYVFVSSISVYDDFSKPVDESTPVAQLEDPATEEIMENYGALKAACETVIDEVYGDRGASVRAGLIVGPYDPTDRFTYWPRRIAAGGDVLGPGDPSAPVQFVDARDLGAWLVQLALAGPGGVFNATGPAEPLTFAELPPARRRRDRLGRALRLDRRAEGARRRRAALDRASAVAPRRRLRRHGAQRHPAGARRRPHVPPARGDGGRHARLGSHGRGRPPDALPGEGAQRPGRERMTERRDVPDHLRVKREPQRGVYDRATIDAILDEALVCHLGFELDGQPYVIPTLHARVGDRLYVHGSAASRMLRHAASELRVCVTVTLLDGLVLARSVFNHSINYRSVVVLGSATIVEDDEKREALHAFTEHVAPGRWAEARQPTDAGAESDLDPLAAADRGLGEGAHRPARGRSGGPRLPRLVGRRADPPRGRAVGVPLGPRARRPRRRPVGRGYDRREVNDYAQGGMSG